MVAIRSSLVRMMSDQLSSVHYVHQTLATKLLITLLCNFRLVGDEQYYE